MRRGGDIIRGAVKFWDQRTVMLIGCVGGCGFGWMLI